MTKHKIAYLAVVLLVITGSMVSSCEGGREVERPNIILCMADDLGWGDVGYNGNQVILTPNLDQMAAEGIRFNRFYSGSSVCSPTRGVSLQAGILTAMEFIPQISAI